jgi:hypothetical protein
MLGPHIDCMYLLQLRLLYDALQSLVPCPVYLELYPSNYPLVPHAGRLEPCPTLPMTLKMLLGSNLLLSIRHDVAGTFNAT